MFFVKYNDPIYVKLEKLDIMIRLASPHNIAQVLAELKEYATEVDVDFVRKVRFETLRKWGIIVMEHVSYYTKYSTETNKYKLYCIT